MSSLKQIATDAVNRWERKAKGETYLSEMLHFKAKAWLVEEVEAAAMQYAATIPPAKASAENDGRAVTAAIKGQSEKPVVADDQAAMEALKGKLKGNRRAIK